MFNRARVAVLGTVRQSYLLSVLFGGCCVIIFLAEGGHVISGHRDGLLEDCKKGVRFNTLSLDGKAVGRQMLQELLRSSAGMEDVVNDTPYILPGK